MTTKTVTSMRRVGAELEEAEQQIADRATAARQNHFPSLKPS